MRVLLSGANVHLLRRAGHDRRQLHPVSPALDRAKIPQSFDHPGIDYTRFNVPYWQKWERMLRFARERDMIISVIQDISDGRIHPAAGSEDERRYSAMRPRAWARSRTIT